jgi:prolyl-tRNA synthetase
MKASSTFISTLKEAPADAEIVSHRLMMRAGFIKRLGAGIYSYMPLGLRVVRKVEAIIREEMVNAGSAELLMPVVQPAELWQESGRFQAYGPELMRVKDRHDRDFVIQPTSEEVITDIARQELRSYKQLPRSFFHIQTKFRDERRPRFGVMRSREFTMKDAYSFDRDKAGALRSYERMVAAYNAIFTRFGLRYRAVAADTGAIGGDASQEFQVIADTGEDAIVYCPTSDYAANIELAEALPLNESRAAPSSSMAKTSTPGRATCEEVASFLGLPLSATVKSLVLATDEKDDKGDITKTTVWLLLVRGDHSLNEIKAGKVPGLKAGFRFATVAEIEDHFGCKPGYLGPIGTRKPVKVIADRTVHHMADFVCGANAADFHITGVNWGPRPARARRGGRHPQRGRRRSLPRRQGRACHPARYRSRTCVLSRDQQVQPANGGEFSRRERQAAAVRDGLLWHRRHPHPGRGCRAEPRRAGHDLAGLDRAFCRGDLPYWL